MSDRLPSVAIESLGLAVRRLRSLSLRRPRPVVRSVRVRAAARVAFVGIALCGVGVPIAQADDRYNSAAEAYRQGRWSEAAAEFQAFLNQTPDEVRALQARWLLAESLVQTQEFAAAQRQFAELPSDRLSTEQQKQREFRLAEIQHRLDQRNAARHSLQAFRQRYPADPRLAYVGPYLGEIALADGDAPAAEAEFRAALQNHPNGPLDDLCRLGLARALEMQQKLEEAERYYLGLAGRPTSRFASEAQFRLGALQYGRQDYLEAERTFAELDARPANAWQAAARLGRARAQFQLQRYPPAEALLLPLVDHPELAVEAGYWLGQVYKAQRRWEAAAEVLLTAADRDPGHPLAPLLVFHAGDALRLAARRGPADACFDRLLADWPDSRWTDDALLGKLQLALSDGDGEAAEQWARRLGANSPAIAPPPAPGQQLADPRLAASRSSAQAHARRLYARWLLSRGRAAEAHAVVAPLASSAAAAPADRYFLAAALLGMGRAAEALEQLHGVLQHAQGDLRADALIAQSQAFIALDRHGEAIEPLLAFLQVRPDGGRSAACRGDLAYCYLKTRQVAQARRAWNEATSRENAEAANASQLPLASPALLAPQALRLAKEAADQEQFAWAVELYQHVLTGGDARLEPEALAGLAWMRHHLAQPDDAYPNWRRLAERHPEHPLASEAALWCGRLAEQRGAKDEAAAWYQKVVDGPASPEMPAALLAAAQLQAGQGDAAKAESLYARFAERFPADPQRDVALYRWAWVLRELGRSDEADQRFLEIYSLHRPSPLWADAAWRLAERRFEQGRLDECEGYLESLAALESQSAGDRPSEADDALIARRLFLAGKVAMARGDWPRAESLMQTAAQQPAANPRTALLARYWAAEAVYQQNRFEESSRRFAELSASTGGGEPWMAMIPLRQAQSLVHLRRWSEALAIAQEIPAAWPAFEQAYEADYVVGRCLVAQGKLTDAREAYQRVVRSPQGAATETAAMAQWMIGESYLHQKDYLAAVREYLRVESMYAFPSWQAAGLLQAGKCFEHLGQWEQAIDAYLRIVQHMKETPYHADAVERLEVARTRSARQ